MTTAVTVITVPAFVRCAQLRWLILTGSQVLLRGTNLQPSAAIAAGINQADKTPPEWKQGAEGFGKRFVSDFGIAAVTTTTRYSLARVFREDTLYYRCECKRVFPRLSHAMLSTFTSRRGDDG